MKFFHKILVVLVGMVGTVDCAAIRAAKQEEQRAQERELRVTQANVLWDNGYGETLGYVNFANYLITIPMVPSFPPEIERRFPLLVLVDARLNSHCACSLLLEFCYGYTASETGLCGDNKRVEHNQILSDGCCYDQNTDRYPSDGDPEVYWIRVQDGQKSMSVPPADAVKAFAADEVPLTAREGLALFAQYPKLVEERALYMLLPGTDHECYKRHSILMLGRWDNESLGQGEKLTLYHLPPDKPFPMNFCTPSRAK